MIFVGFMTLSLLLTGDVLINQPHLQPIQFVNPEIRNQEDILISFFILASRHLFVKTHIVETEEKESSKNDFRNQKSAKRNQNTNKLLKFEANPWLHL